MKAIAVRPKEKDSAELIDTDLPDLGDEDVLVKVRSVGLDGTDKDIFDGVYGASPPGEEMLIPGHESLGRVEEVGEDVRSLRPGDTVVATVRRPDDCINCLAGEYDMCLKGGYTERGLKGQHGFLSERYVEDEAFLIKVPPELGDLAVLLEPMSVAEKAVRMAFAVQKRLTWHPEVSMVTGTGSLGLLTAMLLRLRGLGVISVDRSDDEYKAGIFSDLGILHFNTEKTDLHDIPEAIGKEIDLIVEETGSSSVALHSIMVVGTNGVVILASITGGDKRMEICSDCFNQGLVLGNKAVVGTVNAHRRDFERGIVDLLAIEERWPGVLSRLITARYPLEDFKEALSSMHDNIKVVIDLDGGQSGGG